MPFEAVHGRGAASAAFGAALVVYGLTGPFAPVWPTQQATTAPGLYLVDVLARVPFGDPVARVATFAVVSSAAAAALVAWILARQAYGLFVAGGCALVAAFGASAWRQATADAPGSIAALLVACAIAIAYVPRRSIRVRTIVAALALLTAVSLQPAVLAAIPLVVTLAAAGSNRALVVSGIAGILITWALPDPSSRPLAEAAMQIVRDEWLLPGTAFIISGLVAPLWGAAWAPVAVVGTALAAALVMIGHDASSLAPFSALLMAHGLVTVPAIGPRPRAAVALVLAAIAASYRWHTPAQPVWRVIAWRDAIERTLPAGATISTGMRTAAALNGPLFAGRASGITIRYARAEDGTTFPLDDLRASIESTGRRLDRVQLTFASVADVVTRLPAGTIVGLAISATAASEDRPGLAAALSVIGRTPDRRPATAFAAVGIASINAGSQPPEASDRIHVLIGELIPGSRQRSPADFELRATSTAVSIKLNGRDLVAGDGWAVIAVDPRGPQIDAFANESGRAEGALHVPGLDVWRLESS